MCLHMHQKCDGLPLCPYGFDEVDCGELTIQLCKLFLKENRSGRNIDHYLVVI